MFDLISKKKVIAAIEYIMNEYDDVNKAPKGFGRNNFYYFACGNMNAANYIAWKIGIDKSVLRGEPDEQ